ncbi:MAG: 2Fe-2S iron-sulfur cluster-binding protein [Myxococcota bacterium]
MGRTVEIPTDTNVLQALLAEKVPVKMACGGRGLCATCHVYIEHGADALTPLTKKEKRTLSVIGEAKPCSRLACQARVIRDGVTVKLPDGLYMERTGDLDDLVGRRADMRVLHPVDGRELVAVGKIITRSVVRKLTSVETEVQDLMAQSRDVSL